MQRIFCRIRLRHCSGCMLIALALPGDCALGLDILNGASIQLLWLHMLAVLLCVIGINLVSQPGSATLVECFRLNRWSATSLFLCLATFPGFGMLACGVGLLATRCLPAGSKGSWIEKSDDEPVLPPMKQPDLEVQPLVDILLSPQLEMKRAAVAALGHLATPDAIRTLRQLLSHPVPEIRSDASIALTCIEDELSHALNDALEKWRSEPRNVACMLHLVDQYQRYASSNLLDAASQQAYLRMARDLMRQVEACPPLRGMPALHSTCTGASYEC